jgi:hypothetical protein
MKKILPFLLLLFLINFVLSYGEEPTYAEKLGWEKGSKVLIFHIDDVGLCHGANKASIEALTNGIATSCSVMMPCAWVDEFAKERKKNLHWKSCIRSYRTKKK